ncbi:MAG: glycoside hydrolase family 3 [Ignavibacteriae bacterium HGW-Ignavibacteriae-1]|nr:MAG: glycoside hydrolase family 3 [Ignavibacteriae bacterium HGW-Ignavibacteriae-1]
MKYFILKKIVLLIFLVIFAISCSEDNSINSSDEELNEWVGQMLMVGFRGLEIENDSQIATQIRLGRIGGVVLFSRDVALGYGTRNIQSPWQVKLLNSQLQSHAKIPLLIAVDQEGGYVARLNDVFGFPETVSQQYLGDADNEFMTTLAGQATARTLSEAGFNQNLAPVVDLNINPESPAIGAIGRSFSASPDVVVRNSAIIIDEHRKKNLITTLKHFPGHGSAQTDSHLGLTDITTTWQNIELEPYSQLINMNKADVVMTAHVFNSNLDAEYPATLSKKIITGILREQLNFDGVVITDDMNMKSITDHYGLESAIELTILAGSDIIIFANNIVYDELIAEKAHKIIVDLVKSGKISRERIKISYDRVMKLKSQYLIN